MACVVEQIHPNDLHRFIPTVLHWLEDVEKRSHGEFTVVSFMADCLDQTSQLWAVWPDEETFRAVAIIGTSIETTGTGERQARVIFGSGSDAAVWTDQAFATIEEWARWSECRRLVVLCRPGWAKAFRKHGYALRHEERVKEFSHGQQQSDDKN